EQRHLPDDHLLDEDVEDEFLAEAVRVDAHVLAEPRVPLHPLFGPGVVAVDEDAVNVEEDGAGHQSGGRVWRASEWSTVPRSAPKAALTIWCCCTRVLPRKASEMTVAA